MGKNGKQSVGKKEYKKAKETSKETNPYDRKIYKKDIEFAIKSTKLKPKSAKAWYLLWISNHRAKLYDKAIKACKEAISLDTGNALYWYSLGASLHGANLYDKAIEACEKSISLDAGNALYWYSLGASLHGANLYDKAIEAKNKAITLDDTNALYWYSLGKSYYNTNLYDKAIEACEKAISLEDGSALLWYALGMSFHAANLYDKAIEAKDKAVILDTTNALYRYSLWESYHALKLYGKAIEVCEKAISLEDGNALYWYAIGASYYNTDLYDKAIEACENATSLEDGNALYWYALGISYHGANLYDKAVKALEKSVKFEPQNPLYIHRLAISYRKIKKFQKAKDLSERAVELVKDIRDFRYSSIFYFCGWMNYLITGNIGEAKKYFSEGKKNLTADKNNEIVNAFISTLIGDIKDIGDIKENNHFIIIQCFAQIHSDILKCTQYHFINKIITDFKERPEIQAKIIGVQVSTRRIMNYCEYKGTEEVEFYHYSKINSLCKIVRKDNKDDKGKDIRLRLNNASYMNDPSEGRMLIDYIRNCFADKNSLLDEFCKNYYLNEYIDMQASNVYLFSLTFAVDDLPMWIQYGDQGNGYCFGMKSRFFDMTDYEMQHDIISCDEDNFEIQKKYIPYRVIYIDNHCDKGTEIHFGDMTNDDDRIKSAQIKDEIKKISSCFDDISKLCRNNKSLKDKALSHLKECIEQIRYLFKSHKYEYEKEFRLIRYAQINSNEVKENLDEVPVPNLYVEKDDGKPLSITKIILGPKVTEPSKIVPYIKHANPEIPVVKSNVEFR